MLWKNIFLPGVKYHHITCDMMWKIDADFGCQTKVKDTFLLEEINNKKTKAWISFLFYTNTFSSCICF